MEASGGGGVQRVAGVPARSPVHSRRRPDPARRGPLAVDELLEPAFHVQRRERRHLEADRRRLVVVMVVQVVVDDRTPR